MFRLSLSLRSSSRTRSLIFHILYFVSWGITSIFLCSTMRYLRQTKQLRLKTVLPTACRWSSKYPSFVWIFPSHKFVNAHSLICFLLCLLKTFLLSFFFKRKSSYSVKYSSTNQLFSWAAIVPLCINTNYYWTKQICHGVFW